MGQAVQTEQTGADTGVSERPIGPRREPALQRCVQPLGRNAEAAAASTCPKHAGRETER